MNTETTGRLFLASGFDHVSMDEPARDLGTSKKTIYHQFPDKHSQPVTVLDRQFPTMQHAPVTTENTQEQPLGMRVQRFVIAAGSELARIGAAQLASGRGEAMMRQYVEQRVDAVVYRRLDELFRDGHRRGVLLAPPELLSEILRGALERLLSSRLPYDLDWTAADLLRATVDTVLYGVIRPAHRSDDDERLQEHARDDEQETGR